MTDVDTVDERVLFQPFEKQEEFMAAALEGKYQFVLYGGAIRGGKTFALLGLFIFLCKMYPGSRWAIVRKDMPTIQRNTYPSLEKILPKAFLVKRERGTDYVMQNGSRLIFFPENYNQDKELNRWRGLEVNGIGFEEINECQEASFYKAFERAGSYIIIDDKSGKPKAIQPKPLVVGTCNPSKSWVKKLIYDPYTEDCLKPSWKYIHSRIYDNKPLLDAQPGLLDSYKGNMPDYEFKLFVEGDWNARQPSENAFCTYFNPDKHVSDRAVFQDNLPIYITLDFNLEPFGFIFEHKWRDSSGFHIHQFDEAKISNGDIEQGIELIMMKYGRYTTQMVITGDNMGAKKDFGRRDKASYYERIRRGLGLRNSQLEINPNPNHKNSRTDVNYVLYHFDDNIINPSCSETIYDMESVEVDAFGSILKSDRKNLAQRADFLDCKRYSFNDKFVQSWIKWHQSQYRPVAG